MTVGEHYPVTVTKIMERGAVVSIQGTDKTAFIHISKVAAAYVQNISEYLEVGQTYDAECLEADKPELSLVHLNLRSKFAAQERPKVKQDKKREMSLDDMIAKANAVFKDKQHKKNNTMRRPPKLHHRKNDYDD